MHNHTHIGRIVYRMSSTLQILKNGKDQLKLLNKTKLKPCAVPNASSSVTANLTGKHQKLKQYLHLGEQHIRANYLQLCNVFAQLEPFKNKLAPNESLSEGTQFQQYPLKKIIHICLKLKLSAVQLKDIKWQEIENRVNELFRNTSSIENTQLLFIAYHRFSNQMVKKIISSLQQQLSLMTVLEKQFLFYTLCHLQPNSQKEQNLKTINELKQKVSASMFKSKLSVQHLIQWVLLSSIVNAPHTNVSAMLKLVDKVTNFQNNSSSKNILNVEMFYSLMVCLQCRAMLTQNHSLKAIRQKGRQLIQFFRKSISNHQIMIDSMKQKEKLNLKMMMSYCLIGQTDNRLTFQELTGDLIQHCEALRYLHWMWKNNLQQHQQLKSIYQYIFTHQSSNKQQMIDQINEQQFKNIKQVYFICWLQLAFKVFTQHKFVISKCKNMSYIPRGLEWPLYNYLAKLVKSKQLTSQDKQAVQQIVNKIKNCSQSYNKQAKMAEISKKMSSIPEIQELNKFFHQIRLWAFTRCEQLGYLEYIPHYINHQIRIILNCITKSQLAQRPKYPRTNQEQQSEKAPQNLQQHISNQHRLNKQLLHDNFGYSVIDINVQKFMDLDINQRVQWLRSEVSKCQRKGQITSSKNL